MICTIESEHVAGLCRGAECGVVYTRTYTIHGKEYRASVFRCSASAAMLFAQQGAVSLANEIVAESCQVTIARSTKLDYYIDRDCMRQRTLSEAMQIVGPCTDHGALSRYYVVEDIVAAMGEVWTCQVCGSTGQTIYDKKQAASWTARVYDDVSRRWIDGETIEVACCTAIGCRELAIEVAKKESLKSVKELKRWVREKRQWRSARKSLQSVRNRLSQCRQ